MELTSHTGTMAETENSDPAIEILSAVKAARFVLILVAILGAMIGGTLALTLPPTYQAAMTLIPAQAGANASAEDFIAAASPTLASLVGSRNSRTGNSDFNVFLESMTSLDTARVLQSDHNLLQILYAQRWDDQHRTWKKPISTLSNIKQSIYSFFGRKASRDPTVEDIVEILKKRVKISLDRISGFQNVTFSDRDPKFAAQLLNWVFEAADKVNRARILDRSRSEAAALKGMVADTSAIDERQALLRRLVNDELVAKLSETGQPIAASRIEPAWGGPDQIFPVFSTFVLAGAGIAFAFGLVIAVFRGFRRSMRMIGR